MGKNKNIFFRKKTRPYDGRDTKDAPLKKLSKENFTPEEVLREDKVGISEFTTECAGFSGIIKSRFSDFHVNEINQNGIVELTDLSVPKWQCDLIEEEKDELQNKLKDILTDNAWEQLDELAKQEHSTEVIKIDISNLDKEMRTNIHKLLQKKYGDIFLRDVYTEPENAASNHEAKRYIGVTLKRCKSGKLPRYEGWRFSQEYVHFTVQKENLDTSDVVTMLATRLRCHPSKINYAGTKDKRAKTTQRFCIRKRTPEDISKAIASIRNIHVGNFEFLSNVLKLGNLKGNRFRIALRHVSGNISQIEEVLQEVRKKGFINYFGLQRFGNCASIPTHEVGIALLKGDYKLACELILKPRQNDFALNEMRNFWWETRDATKALQMLGRRYSIEKKLLEGLSSCHKNDYMTALKTLPRNMLMLYTHAYQSLVFNRIASRRIKEFGLKPIPGDLVYCNKEAENVVDLDFDIGLDNTQLCSTEKDKILSEEKTENDTAEVNCSSEYKSKVRELTEIDVANGNYSIYDVVLPLPGYDITYPNNTVGTWYEEILNESGLSSKTFRNKVKILSLGGSYRKLVIQTSDLTWHFRRYSKPEDTLILSDIERLKNVELVPEPEINESNFLALILELTLPTCVYATMFLRELLKYDTSASSQMQLEALQLKK